MFELKKLNKNDKSSLISIKEIYENSFPSNERRDFNYVIELIENNLFTVFAITFEDRVIGLLSSWDFTYFTYIEHFAINENFRNNGVGSHIFQEFINKTNTKIIFEVDLPEDDISLKRIGFYKKFGFTICKETYMQPPYDSTKESVPMLIMASEVIESKEEFETIKKTLYQKVYLTDCI